MQWLSFDLGALTIYSDSEWNGSESRKLARLSGEIGKDGLLPARIGMVLDIPIRGQVTL